MCLRRIVSVVRVVGLNPRNRRLPLETARLNGLTNFDVWAGAQSEPWKEEWGQVRAVVGDCFYQVVAVCPIAFRPPFLSEGVLPGSIFSLHDTPSTPPKGKEGGRLCTPTENPPP